MTVYVSLVVAAACLIAQCCIVDCQRFLMDIGQQLLQFNRKISYSSVNPNQDSRSPRGESVEEK